MDEGPATVDRINVVERWNPSRGVYVWRSTLHPQRRSFARHTEAQVAVAFRRQRALQPLTGQSIVDAVFTLLRNVPATSPFFANDADRCATVASAEIGDVSAWWAAALRAFALPCHD